jgi:hypothetical protein
MNWYVPGRKGYGRLTELRRQTSECMFGTSTPCMTYRRMGYTNPAVYSRLHDYTAMAQEVHGPDYDPSTEPIDPDVLMRVGGGKRHGRYWIADGAIDSSSTPTLSQVRARSTGLSPAIRPRHDSSQHRIQQLEVSASITHPSLSYIPSL